MDQLKQIIERKLESEKRLAIHRNLFVLGCLGGGFRVSDLKTLPKPKYEDYRGEYYYAFAVKSKKTGVKSLAPIPPELNYIIEAYPFGIEIKENEFLEDIKQIGFRCGWTQSYSYSEELADGTSKLTSKPFNEMLMSRTCRKTYCSLLYNFWNLNITECMDFSGHESEDEFLKYLQIDKKVKAQKLIDRFKIKPIFEL